MKNANDVLFRCSSLGHLIAGPREKAGEIQKGTKTNLIDVFISAHYKRREEIDSKFLTKGNQREQDAITLLSRVKKIFFKKNDIRLSNEYITGEPDTYIGKSIHEADETFDTKASWSAHTFFRAQSELNDLYLYQGHGYMALTGAKKHTVAYCLINGLPQAIDDEKKKLAYKMNLLDPSTSQEYKDRCKQIEINHIFDINAFVKENPYYEFYNDLDKWDFDIPMTERVFTYTFNRDEELIQKLYNRIVDCRKWMNANLFKCVPDREEVGATI